jgi:hypothetical protein
MDLMLTSFVLIGGTACGPSGVIFHSPEDRVYALDVSLAQYDPERYRADNVSKIEQFALVEASYVIIRILQTFKAMEAGDDKPFMETVGLTLASKNGTLVELVRR